MKKNILFLIIFVISLITNAQVPTNDTCANATEIIIPISSTNNTTQSISEIINATINNEPGCSNSANEDYAAIWYRFTMPFTGNIRINGLSNNNNFALYDACNGNEISCWSRANIIESLSSGTEYFIKVFRLQANITFGATFFQIQAFETSTNDTCETAESFVISTNQITIFYTIANSISSVEATCIDPTQSERIFDTWYQFTMPFNGNIAINSSSDSNNFAIYEVCNSTEIACFTRRNIIENLSANTTYKIRVFKKLNDVVSTSNNDFQIRAIPLAVNNVCSDSENISVSQTESTVNFDIAGSSVSNTTCFNSTSDFYDLWYDFTMPIEGNLFINSSGNFNNYTLYDACNGNEIACFTNNKLIDGLTVGSNYKLRVYRGFSAAINTSNQQFTTIIYPQATNSTCANAAQTTVTETPTTLNFDILGADSNLDEDCASTQQQLFAIWYDFTMPVTGNIVISNSFSANNVAIYDACSGTKIGCVEHNGIIAGLLANETYKLKVFRKVYNATSGNPQQFDIHAVAAAINDTCETAQNIAVTTTETIINFDMSSAEINNEVGCSSTTPHDYGDIWYNFTMPIDGNLYINSNAFQNEFAIYDSCNGTAISCFTLNGYTYNLTNGSNYKIRLFRTSANLNNTNNSFTTKVFPSAVNDLCTDAINIPITANVPETIDFQLGGADVNTEIGCDTNPLNYVDVWYEFTMPINGSISIENSHPDNYLALYTACNNSTALQCISGNNTFTNLDQGTNYKLRVFRRENENREIGQSFTMTVQSTLATTQLDLQNKIQIFPTLVEEFLTVETPLNVTDLQLEIYNYLGSKVIAVKLTAQENLIHINTLTNGLYLYAVKQQNKIIKTGKLLKK